MADHQRHMNEALKAPFPGIANYCRSFTDERNGTSCRQEPCMCVVKRDAIARALAQAERRGAEAQRSADIELIQATELPSEAPLPWLRAVAKRDDQLITAIRTAPLATPAGDPAPAAELVPGLNDSKSAPATDVRAAQEAGG